MRATFMPVPALSLCKCCTDAQYPGFAYIPYPTVESVMYPENRVNARVYTRYPTLCKLPWCGYVSNNHARIIPTRNFDEVCYDCQNPTRNVCGFCSTLPKPYLDYTNPQESNLARVVDLLCSRHRSGDESRARLKGYATDQSSQ